MSSQGLFDIHIHGIAEADTRSASSDDIISIARYQKSQGTSTILLSIYPGPILEMRAAMAAVETAMEKISKRGISDCAKIAGVHLEGPFLNPRRAGSLDPASFLLPTEHALRELTEGFEGLIRMVTIAPELEGAEKIIGLSRDMGMTVSMGHSDATYAEAEAGKHAGATGITHLFNAMRPLHHREPGITGFGLLDDSIFVEVIADGVHLSLETLRLVFRLKPADRIIVVSDAVKGPRAEDTAVYAEDGTLAGSGVTLSREVSYLIENGFPRETVESAVTVNPHRFLQI